GADRSAGTRRSGPKRRQRLRLPPLQLRDMMLALDSAQLSASVTHRSSELLAQYRDEIYKRTDRLFAWLMGFQWIAGIIFAVYVSPLTWYGPVSQTHIHVWAAVVLGGAICLFPAMLGIFRAGATSTRYTIAVAQMLMGA